MNQREVGDHRRTENDANQNKGKLYLWLGHVVDHQYSQVVQNALVESLFASPETRTLDPTEGTARGPIGGGFEGRFSVVQLLGEVRPELQTGFEHILVL